MFELHGQSAAVTGAGRGIGAEISRVLAGQGAFVHLIGRRVEACELLADEIRRAGGQASAWQADVADSSAVAEVFRELRSGEEGRLDILVNAAGCVADGLAVRLDDWQWRSVLDVNLSGAFYCMRAALRPMIRQKYGRIVNIGSAAGLMGNIGQSNYSAAKSGLIGLSKSVAREVATRGITVNVVAPGLVETRMAQELPEEARREILERIPLGRIGRPGEVASAVAFLVSREAAYTTGAVLKVDGGLSI